MKNPDNHKISRVLVRLDRRFVGVTELIELSQVSYFQLVER